MVHNAHGFLISVDVSWTHFRMTQNFLGCMFESSMFSGLYSHVTCSCQSASRTFLLVFFSSVHCRVLISEADFSCVVSELKGLLGIKLFFPMARSFCPHVLLLLVFLFMRESPFEVNRCFLEFICANDASCTLCLSVASQHMTIGRLLLVAQLSTCT